MKSMELAYQLLLVEEQERLRAKYRKEEQEKLRGLLLELGAGIEERFGELVQLNREQVEELKKLTIRAEAQQRHWYQTGEKTITTATADGTYPEFHNIINALGYPAVQGVIMNSGTGNLFIRFASTPDAKMSGNELKLPPDFLCKWVPEERYPVCYIYIRTDTDNTVYQILAG